MPKKKQTKPNTVEPVQTTVLQDQTSVEQHQELVGEDQSLFLCMKKRREKEH